MSRSPDETPEPLVERIDEGDAWGEFLSESSSELQHLRAELHRQPVPPASGTSAGTGMAGAPNRSVQRLALPPASEPRARSAVASNEGYAPRRSAAASARVPPETTWVPPAGGVDAPRQPWRDSDGMALAALLAHSVPVLWPEAVAIVEELCWVMSRGSDGARAPTLAQIVITPAGELCVLPGGDGSCDTAAVSRLLQALLVDPDTPLPLRLFVSSSTTSSRYDSIERYADALSRYSSANRTELIAALCRRAFRNAAAAADAVTAVPRASAAVEGESRGEGRRPHHWWLWIAAGVALGLAGGAGAWIGYVAAGSSAAAPPRAPAATIDSEVAPERVPERTIIVGPDPWALGTVVPLDPQPVNTSPTPAGGVASGRGAVPGRRSRPDAGPSSSGPDALPAGRDIRTVPPAAAIEP